MYLKETVTHGSATIHFTQKKNQQYISFQVAKKIIFERVFPRNSANNTSENLIIKICRAFQNQDLSQLVLRNSGKQPNLEFLSLHPLGQTLLIAYLAAVPKAINQEVIPETGLTPVLILAQSPNGIEALRVYYPGILEALTHNTLTLHHMGISIENKLLQYLATNRSNEEKGQFCELLEDTLQRCRKEEYEKDQDPSTLLLYQAFNNINEQFPSQTPQKKHETDRSNNLTTDLSQEKKQAPEVVKRIRF